MQNKIELAVGDECCFIQHDGHEYFGLVDPKFPVHENGKPITPDPSVLLGVVEKGDVTIIIEDSIVLEGIDKKVFPLLVGARPKNIVKR